MAGGDILKAIEQSHPATGDQQPVKGQRPPRLLRITTVPISLKLLLTGQLTFFGENGFEILAVSADGPEVKSLAAEGIRHKVVPMTRSITPFRDLQSLWALVGVIREFRPDIVHTHTPKAGLLGMLAAWLCKVPVRMHTVAGLPLMESVGQRRRLLTTAERLTYAFATSIYPNSIRLRDFISRMIRTKTPVYIIGKGSSNGINTDHFKRTNSLEEQAAAIRKKYGVKRTDIVFSFVGRIVRDKGMGEIIAAFKKVRSKKILTGRMILLLIGPFEEDLDPLTMEDFEFIKTDGDVLVAGFQNDVRPWIMASDVFVFPSYREGFPNVVMQAVCLEVPCIVSDINGCNEIISDNETGLIIPVKNEIALALAMETLLTQPELRKQFATRAREHVVSNFDQQFVWRELLGEYRRLLG